MARRVFLSAFGCAARQKHLHLNPFPEEEGTRMHARTTLPKVVRELPATEARKSGGAEYLLSLRERIKVKVFGLRR